MENHLGFSRKSAHHGSKGRTGAPDEETRAGSGGAAGGEEAAAFRVWRQRSLGDYIVSESATWRAHGCLSGRVAGLNPGPKWASPARISISEKPLFVLRRLSHGHTLLVYLSTFSRICRILLKKRICRTWSTCFVKISLYSYIYIPKFLTLSG